VCAYAPAVSGLLALLASALWGGADYLGGVLSRRLPALSVTLVGQAAALIAGSAVVAVLGGFAAPGPYLWWGVACGVVGPVALVAFYTALATGTMGVVAPIAATGVVVPVVVGLLRGERPSALQLGGIAAAVVGVALAVRTPTTGAADGARPVLLALTAAVGFGAVLLLVAEGSATSVGSTLVAQRVTNVALLGGVAGIQRRRTGNGLGLRRRDLPLVTLAGIADVSANGLYGVASRGGLVSVVAVLASLYPLATAVLARQLLGERLVRTQAAGVATALVGVTLMAAG